MWTCILELLSASKYLHLGKHFLGRYLIKQKFVERNFRHQVENLLLLPWIQWIQFSPCDIFVTKQNIFHFHPTRFCPIGWLLSDMDSGWSIQGSLRIKISLGRESLFSGLVYSSFHKEKFDFCFIRSDAYHSVTYPCTCLVDCTLHLV